jgi:hypothetical protein
MGKTREEIHAERQRLRTQYAGLYEAALALLYHHDPVGINFEINPDEYEPEVGTILPRLQSCGSPKDVQQVVYEEFQRWFANSSGPYEGYESIASELWELWRKYLDSN